MPGEITTTVQAEVQAPAAPPSNPTIKVDNGKSAKPQSEAPTEAASGTEGAAAAADGETPAASGEQPKPAEEKRISELSRGFSQLSRKEAKLRAEQKAFETRAAENEKKWAEREALEETFRADPLALLAHYKHTLDTAADFAVHSNSDTAKLKVMETRLERFERERKEEAEKAKAEAEKQTALNRQKEELAAAEEIIGSARKDLDELLKTKEFKLSRATEGIHDEVFNLIERAWKQDKTDLSVKDALTLCEKELARRKKILNDADQPEETQATTQTTREARPQAETRPRTITNKIQAAVPVRKTATSKTRQEVRAEVTRLLPNW